MGIFWVVFKSLRKGVQLGWPRLVLSPLEGGAPPRPPEDNDKGKFLFKLFSSSPKDHQSSTGLVHRGSQIMPIIKRATVSPGAPQQHKQPSRKGKKAWRKNVDVTEIQEGLEEVRDELIKGYELKNLPN